MAWKKRRAGLIDGVPEPAARPPFRVKGKVGRVEGLSSASFLRRYVEKNRPVTIVGAMADWAAPRDWSAEYLSRTLAGFKGETIVSVNGLYPDYLSKPEPLKKAEMSIGEFWERANGQGDWPPVMAADETYYIYGKPHFLNAAPKLKDDAPQPGFLSDASIASLNLWMSSPGCVTPLHYDLTNGALCQIRGVKQVYLFSPDQRDLLYQRGASFPGMDNFERQSQVDIHHPDVDKYPKFREAEALTCLLSPGDILFLPSNWFHEVETLSFSISVSFTFAGGTAASEFAALAELFKDANGAMNMAEIQRRLMQNPAAIQQMMELPMMRELLANPALLAQMTDALSSKK